MQREMPVLTMQQEESMQKLRNVIWERQTFPDAHQVDICLKQAKASPP